MSVDRLQDTLCDPPDRYTFVIQLDHQSSDVGLPSSRCYETQRDRRYSKSRGGGRIVRMSALVSGAKPLARVETRPMAADRGGHLVERVRPLVVPARKSSSFHAEMPAHNGAGRDPPSRRGGPGGDEHEEAVRLSDRPLSARGSGASDRRNRQHGRGAREPVQ